MPEIKNQFTGGKMNKDLDERLVPKGEYRDAMNIQVSTSEGSDVGAVQNILGNRLIKGLTLLGKDATCVGAIADEKNDALYWFVAEYIKNFAGQSINSRNLILQYKEGVITPVFVDKVTVEINGVSEMFEAGDGATTIMYLDPIDPGLLSLVPGSYVYEFTIGLNFFTGNVVSVNYTTGAVVLNVGFSTYEDEVFNSTMPSAPFYVGISLKPVLGFNKNTIITGINIIDDMLFWTDGVTEPKKINILRSIEGTDGLGASSTRLINEVQGINLASNVLVREEHITVIRKAPLSAPSIKVDTNAAEGIVGSSNVEFSLSLSSNAVGQNITMISAGSYGFEVGDVIRLVELTENLPENYDIRVEVIEINDLEYLVKILSLSADADVTNDIWLGELESIGGFLFERKLPRFAYRYKYLDNEYSSFGPFTDVAFFPGEFRYQSIQAYNIGMQNTIRALRVTDFITPEMPKDVKSIDILYKNETSPVIYLLETISNNDESSSGENSWNSIGTHDIPNSRSGSYEVKTESISRALPNDQSLRSWDNVPRRAVAQEISGNRIVYGNYTQGYDIKNNLGQTISPDISMSVVSNVVDTSLNEARKSIKSLRNYEVGVVWGDEYGRETPVVTSKSGSVLVPKNKSKSSNHLKVSLSSSPSWADYYRFYVKETSNEYYNLAVDRMYDAEDGNIWVSFPSVDRNKVDEETYIILKKGADKDELVEPEGRYKIVAIENEAPDYIKTSYDLIVRTNQDESRVKHSCNLWGGSNDTYIDEVGQNTGCTIAPQLGNLNPPTVGRKSFSINYGAWANAYDVVTRRMGLPDLITQFKEVTSNAETINNKMYVSFTKEIDSSGEATEVTAGDKYRVIDIKPSETEDAPMDGDGNSQYIIYLEKPIGLKDDFVVQDTGQNPGFISLMNDGIHVLFWQQTVTNKPEFDGRFFVKILNDSTAKANLSKRSSVLNTWVVAANPSLYKIEDTALNNTNDSTYNFSQNSIDETTTTAFDENNSNFGGLNQLGEWHDALKFGGSVPRSRWFIDNAPFAGLYNIGSDTYTTSFQASNGNFYDSCNVDGEWEIIIIEAGDTGVGSDLTLLGNFGTASSYGRVGMKGIHTTGGSNYIDLSFSQLTPDTAPDAIGTWDIGSPSTNTSMDEHKFVVDRLVLNSRFKLTGGEAIFKITGITKRRLFNYMGAPTIAQSNIPTYSSDVNELIESSPQAVLQLQQISYGFNKRFSYRIKYELDVNASPDGTTITSLADEAGVSNISNTLPGGLQFLTEYNEDEENKISYNPAIFETEPKEDFGLDLYYEASSSLPVFPLTNQNKHLFIPLGTTVVPPYSAGFPSGIFITEWNNLTPGGERIINLSMSISPAEYGVLYGDSGFVQFLRDDGAYVTATLTQPTITESTTQLSITPKNEFGLNWHNCWSFNNGVESNRIGDTFNKPYLSNGVTLSTTAKDSPGQEIRNYGLIYSGIYNSNSSVNNLNQFIAAENITKDINPTYGSIQKLHSGWGQGGDLIALCEDRILKILANKDALFNADGNPQLTSTNSVLGQAIPYSGEYGISKNPESFASEAYRIYFTDKIRGAVMRLSMDGLTPISDHGMKDWFRDNLKLSTKIIGSFDDHNNEYNLTLYKPSLIPVQQQSIGDTSSNNKTVTFREDVKGWVSFKSFVPENAISCANEYYSFSNGRLWQHNVEQFNPLGVEFGRNTFYKVPVDSTFNVILNDAPGSVKSFNTINYEGSQSRVDQFLADGEYHNLHTKKGWYVDSIFTNKETGTINEFIEKEGKWFNYIKGQSIQHYDQHILMNPDGSSTFDQASLAIQGIGILDINPQSVPLEGCTDAAASNFQPSAQIDNGSCIPFVFGCTEPTAFNYNPSANTDDGDNCIWVGCTDATAFNYEPFEEIAYSYSPNNSIFPDDSCEDAVYGCTDTHAFNYNPLANILATSPSDYSDPCIPFVYGCQIPLSDNYNPLANEDDGTCTWLGCTEPLASNYGWFGSLPGSGFPPGASSYTVSENQYGIQNDAAACEGGGCMDPLNGAYDPAAIYDDGSCVVCDWTVGGGSYNGVPIVNVSVADETLSGAGNGQLAVEYDIYGPYLPYTFSVEDDSGNVYTTYGNNQTLNGISNVSHVLFSNLPTGTYDVTIQGSGVSSGCYYTDFTHVVGTGSVLNSGCTDVNACNYDAGADVDNGTCDFTSCSGCNDILADTNSQGLQTGTSNACITPNTFTFGPCTISCGDSLGVPFGNSCCSYTVYGCTDPLACNYMPQPTTGGSDGEGGNTTVVPDGSCSYNGCMDASVGIFPSILGLDQAGNACSYPCQDNSGNDIGFAANNYAPCAAIQEPLNICDYGDLGCMDSTACNFDPNAQVDDGSCVFGFTGATIGDPNSVATTPIWYYGTVQNNSSTVQHYVASYPVSSANENDIGLTIQSVQQNLSQYTSANDKVTVKLWRKQQNPGCGSLGCAWELQHTHDIDINQALWEFGASATDGAVFGGNRTSPGNNPYPWGASSTSGANFAFQPLYYSTVEYAVEITSTIASVTYGESTVIDPSAQTEACGVWKPFTFNPQPNCANPYAILGCTDDIACNYNASATCDDGSCYYGSATLYYTNLGCEAGPGCDNGTLGTSYTIQDACCLANPGFCD